jgi:hypothetical protein
MNVQIIDDYEMTSLFATMRLCGSIVLNI